MFPHPECTKQTKTIQQSHADTNQGFNQSKTTQFRFAIQHPSTKHKVTGKTAQSLKSFNLNNIKHNHQWHNSTLVWLDN